MHSQEQSNDTTKIIIAIIGFVMITLIVINWRKIFSAQSLTPLMGEWQVTEKLNRNKDRSEITWEYRADIVNKNILRMSGRKIKVDNRAPNKQEKAARVIYNCTFKDLQSRCKLDQLNSNNPILGAEAKLNFTDDQFNSFNGNAYENGKVVSTLTGYKQENK
jgi:hypothetical protein